MKKTVQLNFSNQIAHIEVATRNGEQVITKTWGTGFGWSENDAKYVIEMHRHYIANLRATGLTTSQPIKEEVVSGSRANEFFIQSTEKFFDQGDLLAVLMRSKDKSELVKTTAKYVQYLAATLFAIPPLRKKQYGVDWLWMSVALDLKPQNVVLAPGKTGTEHVILIDTFRPQIWSDDEVKLLPLPSADPAKRKIPRDEIKTGNIRFQAGRLWGYFVAIATRWAIEKNGQVETASLDALRSEVAANILTIVKETLANNEYFSNELRALLVTDVQEIVDESIIVGDYEGPRYVQSLYENEQNP